MMKTNFLAVCIAFAALAISSSNASRGAFALVLAPRSTHALTLTVQACSYSIGDVATWYNQSTFYQLLVAAGLDGTLNDTAYTVFVPSEDAFSVAFDYLNTDVDTLSEESLSDVVATILAYHVTTEYLPDLGNITQVLPIITSLGSQAALAAFPGDLGDDVPFTLQAENTLASPLEEVPFFDNPGCEHALYFIDSLLLPKVVYPALGLQAELPSDGAEEGAGAPAAAPPALSISG